MGVYTPKKKKKQPPTHFIYPNSGDPAPSSSGGTVGERAHIHHPLQVVSTVRLLPSEGRLLDPGR